VGPRDHASFQERSQLALLRLGAAQLIAEFLEPHEYYALASLQSAVPGCVEPRALLRSMGLLEAEVERRYIVLSKQEAAQLMGSMGAYGDSQDFSAAAVPEDDLRDAPLIHVWSKSNMKDFKFAECSDSDGRLLAHAAPFSKAPTVADSRTFIQRFHRRTGGVLQHLDWSYVRAIGGMVVACLVADEDVFATQFEDSDVDLCFVGISGEELQKKVVEVVQSICASARTLRVAAAVIRTPLTVTLNLSLPTGVPLPNVQLGMKPYLTTTHLVFTTDISDCTAMAFDGHALFAAPRAREAIATRRNIARPEKYHCRGEWNSEAVLLKYAKRGFRVVDIGIRADCPVAPVEALSSMARNARQEVEARLKSGLPINKFISCRISALRAVGVHGAHLLLLAEEHDELRQFMLAKAPLLRNGLSHEELSALAHSSSDWVYGYSDGYGRCAVPKLRLLCTAESVDDVVAKQVRDNFEEFDFRDEAHVHDVRGWYDGI